MTEGVRWEIEYPMLRIDGDIVVWTIKNVGDDDAPSGSSLGTVSICRLQSSDTPVDTTPFTNEITLDRDVAAGTAHAMSYPLTWTGQEPGNYRVTVTPHDDAWADLDFLKTIYGVEHGY
jgi:hypothetical protein